MIWQPNKTIDLERLPEIARRFPKMTNFLKGIQEIDLRIKNHIKEVTIDKCKNSDQYYLKTELQNQCYNVYLFQAESRKTVGFSIPLADLLEKCQNKTVFNVIDEKTSKCIVALEMDTKKLTNKINWIY